MAATSSAPPRRAAARRPHSRCLSCSRSRSSRTASSRWCFRRRASSPCRSPTSSTPSAPGWACAWPSSSAGAT
eukprot:2298477-Prymnesium_polylepis.1